MRALALAFACGLLALPLRAEGLERLMQALRFDDTVEIMRREGQLYGAQVGQDMLAHPVELLPHAYDTVALLARQVHLLLITKGDLLDQERKLAQSGLGDLFDSVEIVSEKTPAIYKGIFARHGDGAENGLMVGNSMKSDVVPMIQAGGWGVHVPHELAWDLEHANPPLHETRYRALDDLGGLPWLVARIS